MNVITLKQHRYRGKLKTIGDEYDFIGRQERKIAFAMGWVAAIPPIVQVESEKPAHSYFAAAFKAEEPKETEKPKRQYRRRNLTAEE
jgi:hypothetical protein